MRLEDALRGNAQTNKTNVTKGEIYSLRRIISRINISCFSQPLLCQGGKKKKSRLVARRDEESCSECIHSSAVVRSWCAALSHQETSSGSQTAEKTHLLKKHKLRRTKGAREEQRALLINESLARRFVCLILPASTFFFFLVLQFMLQTPTDDIKQKFWNS